MGARQQTVTPYVLPTKLTLVVLGEVAADDLVDSGPLRGGGVRSAHLAALRPDGGPAGGTGNAGVDGHGCRVRRRRKAVAAGERALVFEMTSIRFENTHKPFVVVGLL